MNPLDSEVELQLARHGVPGCQVAVLDGGETVHVAGYGTSRLLTAAPVGPTTRMQACSMSKPVAIVAALRLVEQGLLDLDADVADRLTRWTLPTVGGWRPRITLRQLASHTAGLTAHPGFPGYRRGERLPSLTEVLSGVHPANAPGSEVDIVPGISFRYSGLGTTIVQLLIEEVTGRGAGEAMTSLVLEPFGMQHSTFDQDVDDDGRAHGHLARGVTVGDGWRVHPELCAAGLWTTAGDYLRLLRGVQETLGGDHSVLATGSARDLLTPVAPLPDGRDPLGMDHVGLGFFVATRDGETRWFGHTGSNLGFVCASMASVRGGRGAVVLTNGDGGAPVVRAVLRAIALERGWDAVPTSSAAPVPVPTTLGARAGTYIGTGGLRAELLEHEGTIGLVVSGQEPLTLSFTGPSTLAVEGLDVRVQLEDGAVLLEQGGGSVRLRRSLVAR